MKLALAAIWFGAMAFGQEVTVEQAAKSPYDLAKYIDSHPGADMTPVWKAMGVTDGPARLTRCEPEPGSGPCEIEAITLLKPSQVILLLQGFPVDEYLRFLGDGNGWRFAGETSAILKNFPRRHEVIRVGGKPFLTISGQGASGTGIDSEVQTWFDLSRAGFEPVFGFTVHGEEFGGFMQRAVRADAYPYQVGSLEGISVHVRVDFSFGDLHLISNAYTATYERAPGQKNFSFKSADSGGQPASMSEKEFEALANINQDDMTLGDGGMLRYVLPALEKIASGKDPEARNLLRMMLEDLNETPEKEALLELLAKP